MATSAPLAPALANPRGGTVTAGTATITSDRNRTDIRQTTDRAIIDWRSFSIATDEITRFHQPSASAVTLNRVTGADPSHILGQLRANGQIFLVNPNGILFGAGARIDVAGLAATTADIANVDFMAGRYEFRDGATVTGAGVVNRGQITIADSGYAALVGPYVRNEGVINARLGRVMLGGFEAFALDLYGDGLVTFRVGVSATPTSSDGEPVKALAANAGTIAADGGTVRIAAHNVGAVVQNVVNMDGVIHANSIENRNGVVILSATGAGDVAVGGNIAAAGGSVSMSSQGDVRLSGAVAAASRIDIVADTDGTGKSDSDVTTTGGDVWITDGNLSAAAIDITGDRVALTGETILDASGAQGGGVIRVGGAYQGGDGLRAADATHVGADVALRADAGEIGDGGTIIVWAGGSTRFLGSLSATGGAEGGDGGFAEVSAKQYLDFRGTTLLTASHGALGTLLLDPTDVEIVTGGPAATTDVDQFSDPGALVQIDPATLDNGANIVIQATNNILITNNIALNTNGASLTLTANNAIIPGLATNVKTRNANITFNGTLDLKNGFFDIDAAGSPTTGNVTMSAVVDSLAGGATFTIYTGAGSTVSMAGINFGNNTVGGLQINADNIDTGSYLIGSSVALNSTATGAINGSGLDVGSLTITNAATVDLFGTVNGVSGEGAAAQATMTDASTHLINYCQKGGACFYPPAPGDLDLVPTDPTPTDPPPVDDTPVVDNPASDSGSDGGGGDGGSTAPGGSDVITDGTFDTLPGDTLALTDFGLDFFLVLLEEEGLDLEELDRQIKGIRGPLAALAADLDGILDRYELAVASFIPKDAFGGKFAIVVRGLVTFQPPASQLPTSGPGARFVAPGFGIFQQ